MSFSREDLVAYATQPQVQSDQHDPWARVETSPPVKAESSSAPVVVEDVTEPAVQGDNDGSTTEIQAEPVAAPDVNLEDDNTPEVDALADGKPRSRAQERIEELVAERNALRKYGEFLSEQVTTLRKQPVAPVQESLPAVAETEVEAPTLADADFDPVKFNQMQNAWVKKQVETQVASAVKQIEVRQSEQATRQAFESRTAEFRKNAPDFDTVLSNPSLPQLAPEAARIVVRSTMGPAIAYHLGKNPDVATRIARQDQSDQIAAIGRLEEQLSRSTTKEPSKQEIKPAVRQVSVSKAPPPPKPVTSGSAVVQPDMAQMSMEEWVAHERGRKIQERTAKQKVRQSMK